MKNKDKITFSDIFFTTYGWLLFIIIFLLQYFVFLPLVFVFSFFFDKNRIAISYLSKISCMIFFYIFIGYKLNFYKNNLETPKKGEKRIYVINHSSQYDVILMNILPGPIKAVVKEKWANRPLIGHMQRLGGNIIIKDSLSTENAINFFSNVIKKLESAIPIIIFPEGTRSRMGKIQKFYKGTFRMALETRADIVPVVFDSWNTIRPGGLWIRDTKPVIKIMNTIKYDEYKHLSHIKLSKIIRVLMIENLITVRDKRRKTEKHYYRKIEKFTKIDNEMQEELIQLKKELNKKSISLDTHHNEK